MSLISTFDFWIQSTATLFAIVNIYLLTHGYIKRGCQVGLVGQVIWVWIFVDAQQYPLIATDALLFVIYTKKLYEIRYPYSRRFRL